MAPGQQIGVAPPTPCVPLQFDIFSSWSNVLILDFLPMKDTFCQINPQQASQQTKVDTPVIKLLLILLLSIISLGIGVMGMGLGSKLVLFSEVNGQVVDRGKPVAGAIVTRYYNWHWTDAESSDRTVTDKEGKFRFKAITTRSITASVFPHQPVIVQEIDINIDNKIFKAWRFGKMNYDNNGELGGKAICVICDIRTEPEWKGKVFGISRIL